MNIFRFVLSDCDIPPPDVVITGHYTLAYVCRQWWALSQDGKIDYFVIPSLIFAFILP